MEFNHISVLLEESVEALSVKPDGVYADCTAGGGGHSAAVLSRLGKNGRMILLDRDPDAVCHLTERFRDDGRVTIVQENFRNLPAVLERLGVPQVDGVIADLGVSSYQLDTPERGFSFHHDAPLDMRMSKAGRSARDIVNEASFEELNDILRRYGEEKFSRQIASNIVKAREASPIETTLALSEIISMSVPAAVRRQGHPARKSFQAIRIAVNGELDALEEALPEWFGCLKKGGVLAVISFHSLEDRCVKEYFHTLKQGCTCPKDFPVCVCGKTPQAVVHVGSKPKQNEVEDNSRSRSAKLRTARKL